MPQIRAKKPYLKLVAGPGSGSLATVLRSRWSAAGCGNSTSPSANSCSTTPGPATSGGVFTILANSAFGVADPAQNYTLARVAAADRHP